MLPENYNIRVYGLCLSAKGQILVTDERRGRFTMTKFPGGGHHLGEGLGDTVVREFMEETHTLVRLIGLFYINDFLQISAFNPKDQLVSIYYLVEAMERLQVPTTDRVHDFGDQTGDVQTFRWVDLAMINPEEFTYPIDKIVADKLRHNAGQMQMLAGDGQSAAETAVGDGDAVDEDA